MRRAVISQAAHFTFRGAERVAHASFMRCRGMCYIHVRTPWRDLHCTRQWIFQFACMAAQIYGRPRLRNEISPGAHSIFGRSVRLFPSHHIFTNHARFRPFRPGAPQKWLLVENFLRFHIFSSNDILFSIPPKGVILLTCSSRI